MEAQPPVGLLRGQSYGILNGVIQTITVPRLKFRIRLKRDAEGFWFVECPSLPGCMSQGRTRAEARNNIREAIEGWLEAAQAHPETWARGSR